MEKFNAKIVKLDIAIVIKLINTQIKLDKSKNYQINHYSKLDKKISILSQELISILLYSLYFINLSYNKIIVFINYSFIKN